MRLYRREKSYTYQETIKKRKLLAHQDYTIKKITKKENFKRFELSSNLETTKKKKVSSKNPARIGIKSNEILMGQIFSKIAKT